MQREHAKGLCKDRFHVTSLPPYCIWFSRDWLQTINSIAKMTRLYNYQTWPTNFLTRCAKVCGLFSWLRFSDADWLSSCLSKWNIVVSGSISENRGQNWLRTTFGRFCSSCRIMGRVTSTRYGVKVLVAKWYPATPVTATEERRQNVFHTQTTITCMDFIKFNRFWKNVGRCTIDLTI